MIKFLQGVREGWRPEESCCCPEGKEILTCMTWVGRKAAKKFTERVAANVDCDLGKYIGVFVNSSMLKQYYVTYSSFEYYVCLLTIVMSLSTYKNYTPSRMPSRVPT